MALNKCDHEYDKYWRVDNYSLSAERMRNFVKKHGFPSSGGRAKLAFYISRIQRGQLYYQHCNDRELRTFVKDRKITVPEGTKLTSKRTCVDLLEADDKERTLHGFMDLPPELRVTIYERYMATNPQNLRCPVQPPVTRASRLLRTEALSVFYESHTFDVHLHRRGWGGELRFTPEATDFMYSLSSDNCAMMLSLRFVITGVDTPNSVALSFEKNKDKLFTIRCGLKGEPRTAEQEADWQRRSTNVVNKVEEAMKRIIERDGKARLRVDDLPVLRSAIETGWREDQGVRP
ncbi:hypothetical protein LTR42_002868 [Elasticomyces elasticus]|nr:hypothetical protein LTR42_002868 [Elasticomyces elasticus]